MFRFFSFLFFSFLFLSSIGWSTRVHAESEAYTTDDSHLDHHLSPYVHSQRLIEVEGFHSESLISFSSKHYQSGSTTSTDNSLIFSIFPIAL